MSSKKAKRKKRKEELKSEKKKGVNPALLFILGIGLAMAVTLGVAVVLGDSGPGDPPWDGATWSAAHGHWH